MHNQPVKRSVPKSLLISLSESILIGVVAASVLTGLVLALV